MTVIFSEKKTTIVSIAAGIRPKTRRYRPFSLRRGAARRRSYSVLPLLISVDVGLMCMRPDA